MNTDFQGKCSSLRKLAEHNFLLLFRLLNYECYIGVYLGYGKIDGYFFHLQYSYILTILILFLLLFIFVCLGLLSLTTWCYPNLFSICNVSFKFSKACILMVCLPPLLLDVSF